MPEVRRIEIPSAGARACSPWTRFVRLDGHPADTAPALSQEGIVTWLTRAIPLALGSLLVASERAFDFIRARSSVATPQVRTMAEDMSRTILAESAIDSPAPWSDGGRPSPIDRWHGDSPREHAARGRPVMGPLATFDRAPLGCVGLPQGNRHNTCGRKPAQSGGPARGRRRRGGTTLGNGECRAPSRTRLLAISERLDDIPGGETRA
jgi:hypothetical protein